MRTRFLIAGFAALLLIVMFVNTADAHRWGRRGYCRPARVVVIHPVPRLFVPHHARIRGHSFSRGRVYHSPGVYRHYHRCR